MMHDLELGWALAAAGLLLLEQIRHRRALRREVGALRASFEAATHRNEELSEAADRIGTLYKGQLLTSLRRSARIKKVLEIATSINSNLSLEKVLHEIVHAVSDAVVFRIVLLRVLNAEEGTFEARAFAGLAREAIHKLEQHPVRREEFESWLREEFRISRSYFIGHEKHFWPEDDEEGYTPDLGVRGEGEWHPDDVLFVPLYTKDGAVMGYLSVDDPVDRKPPTRETIEVLEILATQAVVALQNAALYARLHEGMRQLEEATEHAEELNRLKSSFVSTVSHELRTPLSAIRAYTEELLQRAGDPNPRRQLEFLNVIHEQSLKLQRLIESILDLSQLESGRIRMHREPEEGSEDREEGYPDLIEADARVRTVGIRGTLSAGSRPVRVDLALKCSASRFANQYAFQFSIIDRSSDAVTVDWDLLRNLQAAIRPSIQPVPGGNTYIFLADREPDEADGLVEIRTKAGQLAGRFKVDGFKLGAEER